jgi:hypothetical protein
MPEACGRSPGASPAFPLDIPSPPSPSGKALGGRQLFLHSSSFRLRIPAMTVSFIYSHSGSLKFTAIKSLKLL